MGIRSMYLSSEVHVRMCHITFGKDPCPVFPS